VTLRRVKLPCFLALLAMACSNDAGALYTRDSGAAGTQAEQQLPHLPALPDDDHRADCERCAARTCDMARANCLMDDDCTDELRCKGKASDPARLNTCSAEFGWSVWYADYANCVFRKCHTECNVGNNWQCQGKYDTPLAAADAPSFDVVFDFVDPPTYFLGGHTAFVSAVGETVRACNDVMDCSDSALDSAKVGIDSKATLRLTASAFQPQDFRGYVEFEELHARRYVWPLSRAQEYFAGAPNGGPPPMADAAKARVLGIAFDCLVAPVAGVNITLPEMPEIRAFSFDLNTGEWKEGSTTGAGVATLINLPDSADDKKKRVLVRATRGDGEVISERRVWTRPGFDTEVLLGPATRTKYE
jgi:hypothetical protein